MFQQVLTALITVVIGVGAAALYFWGSNFLLDFILRDDPNASGPEAVRRDNLRTRIRPWLFMLPAILFLGTYLVYPVFESLRLSLMNRSASEFVGLSNYIWAIGDSGFRGAVLNNILWLIFVPAMSTAIGLLVAVMADRIWWGSIAKTLIFMPMAISFVGASVIWRFVYDYGGPGEDQIGILNAIVSTIGLEPQAWITVPFWNNFFLMIILVWIQTGFAMVILSAALRGIPEETIEAARIDGANDVRIFFDIMIPQIVPTIVVVWTTITITVLKVFDIVLAMTNGQWDTQVLANFMFAQMFSATDFGRGSTVAITIMIAVLPIMIWNIRQANKEEGAR